LLREPSGRVLSKAEHIRSRTLLILCLELSCEWLHFLAADSGVVQQFCLIACCRWQHAQ
jgi:hypothetical protein